MLRYGIVTKSMTGMRSATNVEPVASFRAVSHLPKGMYGCSSWLPGSDVKVTNCHEIVRETSV